MKTTSPIGNTPRNARRPFAAQVVLFAMLVQVFIPLSAAIPLPASAQGASNFYLVICTAFGVETRTGVDDALSEDGSLPAQSTPWDCPVCQLHASQATVPPTPAVAYAPPLPTSGNAPLGVQSRSVALWRAAPDRARAPPAA
ncbi:MAG: DUF2946 family protein [Alphaproteobacteria bacterium]|nr:DUF2946 family protein [Alphaproteobacteria bacterium]